MILVGGLGTRLGALTGGLPKPLTAVGDRPFLAWLLWHARRFGFRKVLLLAGHRSAAIEAFAADPAWTHGLEVSVCIEPEPLGTGGALRHALDRLEPRFLFLNGDSLFDFNWLDLWTLFRVHPRSAVAMALRREADASRFGVTTLAGERVTGFAERGDASGGAINGGVYLVDRELAAAMPDRCSFERDVLPRLAAEGRVVGRMQQGFFLDIGVPEALGAAQSLVPASLRRGAVVFTEPPAEGPGRPGWSAAVAAVKAANDRNRFALLAADPAPGPREFERLQAALRAEGAHLDGVVDPSEGSSPGEWPIDPEAIYVVSRADGAA